MRIRVFFVAGILSLFSSAALAQQQVIWWDFLGGGDGVRMKALIGRFNNEHQDIHINATTFEWGTPYYTKIRTSVAVGQVPDIMTYHLSRFSAGLTDAVLDEITDEDLSQAGLTRADFFTPAIEAATADDGKLYAVPFDIHSIVLYYNKSWLEGSRFLDRQGQLTGINSLADFEAALAFTRKKGAAVPLSYGTSDASSTYRIFYSLLHQLGGTLMSDGEVLAGDNLAKAERVIGIMRHWAEEDWQPEQTEAGAAIGLFTSGRAAFFLYGVWEVPTLIDLEKKGALDFEWSAVEMPNLLGSRTTWADSHAFAIPAGNKMGEKRRRAVMEVIGWMAKNSLAWAEAGHVPALKQVIESDAFSQMQPNANYAGLADTASFDPRSKIAGVGSPVYDAMENIVTPAIHGYLTPREAAEQVRQTLQDALK